MCNHGKGIGTGGSIIDTIGTASRLFTAGHGMSLPDVLIALAQKPGNPYGISSAFVDALNGENVKFSESNLHIRKELSGGAGGGGVLQLNKDTGQRDIGISSFSERQPGGGSQTAYLMNKVRVAYATQASTYTDGIAGIDAFSDKVSTFPFALRHATLVVMVGSEQRFRVPIFNALRLETGVEDRRTSDAYQALTPLLLLGSDNTHLNIEFPESTLATGVRHFIEIVFFGIEITA